MTVYTDSLNGTINTSLDSYDPLWVFVAGDGAGYYGLATATAAGTIFSGSNAINIFRRNVAVGADQFVEIVVENIGAVFDTGTTAQLPLRISADVSPNEDLYRLEVQDDAANGGAHTFQFYKTVNGVSTAIGAAFNAALSNGDTVRAEVSGSAPATLTAKVNGAIIGLRTDSSSPLTAGQIGIGGSKTSAIRSSSWSGGDLSVAVSPIGVINGTAIGSIATVNGTAIGSIATVNGTATS